MTSINYNYNDKEDLVKCCDDTVIFLMNLQDRLDKIIIAKKKLPANANNNLDNLQQINSVISGEIDKIKGLWTKLPNN